MTDPSAPIGLEGPTILRTGRRFRAPLLVREFPPEVPFGFLGRVLAAPGAFRMRMQLHRVPRGRSLDLLEGAGSIAESAPVSETR